MVDQRQTRNPEAGKGREVTTLSRDTLVGMAALHCRLADMGGNKMDKAAMRYTAMADYMEHVAACCSVNPIAVLWEAVETAIVGNAMHTGKPFDRQAYAWMELMPERGCMP